MTTYEIVNVTTAYRVHVTWADGTDCWIGDWPTQRIARQEADAWIVREGR